MTENCVRCFKPAKFETGHVFRGKKHVVAGWCSQRCLNSAGFSGHYLPAMGEEKLKFEVKK